MKLLFEMNEKNQCVVTLEFEGKTYQETWQHEADSGFSTTGQCIDYQLEKNLDEDTYFSLTDDNEWLGNISDIATGLIYQAVEFGNV